MWIPVWLRKVTTNDEDDEDVAYLNKLKELKKFRKEGERFTYLGFDMIVYEFSGYNNPYLIAHYVDGNGYIVERGFSVDGLQALIAEDKIDNTDRTTK